MEFLESRITPTFFFGGVRVAAADVNGDDVQDIVTAAGPGGGAHVRVLSGISGTESLGIAAYDPSFAGGAFVAAGDTTGDGIAEIITGAGDGGGPHVKVFDGRSGQVLREFFAFDAAFTGGVRVAAGDVNGDGRADIICGAGPGGAPVIRVFDGASQQQIGEIAAFDAGFRGGVHVGAGDINGDGRDDVIAGAGAGGAPHVLVFNGASSDIIKSLFAFDTSFAGGVTVAAGNFSSPDRLDIFVGAGPGGAPQARVFSSQTDTVLQEVLPFDAAFRGGVYIGSSRLTDSGLSEILVGAGPGGGAHVRALEGATLAEVAGFCAYIPFTGPFGAFGEPSGTPDTTAPTLTITTQQPTSPVNTNQTIQGTVTDNRPGTTVSAQVDGNPAQNVQVVNGSFSFTTSLPLNGQADGSHTVTFVAQDAAGNQSAPRTFTFTLQTVNNQITLELAPENDGPVLGNSRTNDSVVSLIGTAPAHSTVVLVDTNFSTTADEQGNFRFVGVNLNFGVTSFTARATPVGGGGTVEFTRLIIRNSDPTVEGPIAPLHVASGALATILNMPAIFSDLDVNSLVRFNTGAGSFDLELFDQQTPITVQNLLSYIQRGAYNNSIFHRSVANFVIQGGNSQFNTNPNRLDEITADPAIQNEPGISNQIGTIAMAKLGGDPNSATSEFFFNLQDNSRGAPMLDTQNGGFTAFGQVRGDGMSIINMLAAIPVQDRGGVFEEIPLQNYPQPPDGDFPTDTTPANYAFINSVEIVRRTDARNGDGLVFSVVSNSNPNLVTATLSGARLTLDYAAGQSGRATITLRAVDLEGSVVETTFTVNVGDVPEDTAPPTINITDPPNGQTSSSNVTVQGTVADDVSGVFSLTASIDGGAPVPVTIGNGGAFSFATTFATDGSDDGEHTIAFVGRDEAGNVSAPSIFTFTLDSSVQQLTLRLDSASDTAGGGIGDNNRTILESVTLEGTTEAGATVTLVGTTFTTTADGSGQFSFANVPLELGVNTFTARATDSGSNAREITATFIRSSDPTVASAVQDFEVEENAIPTFLNLPAIFSDVDVSSLIRITTPAGTFDLELFDQQTPQTVANFLAYIDAGRYTNSIFHRSVADFVIQGGGFQFDPGPPANLDEIPTEPAVQNEPGISNQVGTIAMAKLGGDPNSATSQFFFNLADNSRGVPMLDTQNGGFTAFGQLRGNGLTVIQGLAAIPTQDRGGVFEDIPLQNFPPPPAGNFPGDTTAANYAFINSMEVVRRRDAANSDALTYSVVGNTNPNLVEATIVGGKLTLTYSTPTTGNRQSTITLRATDVEGRFVETSFVVTVGDPGTDTTPPTISISSPADAETVSTNVSIMGQVTDDNSGVRSLTLSIDGGAAINVEVDASGNFTFFTVFDLDGTDDGLHTFEFVATDQAGNVSDPFEYTLFLDTSGP
jgi:cyclophilin family peptidyl-prolyl cis-trans isomerase